MKLTKILMSVSILYSTFTIRRLNLRQTLKKVTFAELHEVQGVFGQESISPGGGVFPKHLICSYDLGTQTVIFPDGWEITEYNNVDKDNRRRFMWEFSFYDGSSGGAYLQSVLQHKAIKKIALVEVDDYDQNQFKTEQGLVLMELRIPRVNKDRADELILKHLSDGTIVAERSKESVRITAKGSIVEETVQQYLYELVMKESERINFINQLFEQDIVPKKDRFAILINVRVYPKQLSYFKK